MSDETVSRIITEEEERERIKALHELGRLVHAAGVQTMVVENYYMDLPRGLRRHGPSGPLDPGMIVYREPGGHVTVTTDCVTYSVGAKTMPVERREQMAAWLVLLARQGRT